MSESEVSKRAASESQDEEEKVVEGELNLHYLVKNNLRCFQKLKNQPRLYPNPLQVEEEIQEVTEFQPYDDCDLLHEEDQRLVTTTVKSGGTKKKTLLSGDPSLGHSVDCVLAEIDHERDERAAVPFPEYGADLLDGKAIA